MQIVQKFDTDNNEAPMDTILPLAEFSETQLSQIVNIDAAAQYGLRPAHEPINTAVCEGILEDIDHLLNPAAGADGLAAVETGLILAERFFLQLEEKASDINPLLVDQALVYARAAADVKQSAQLAKDLVGRRLGELDDHFRGTEDHERFTILGKVYARRIHDSFTFTSQLHGQNQTAIRDLLDEYGRQRSQGVPPPNP